MSSCWWNRTGHHLRLQNTNNGFCGFWNKAHPNWPVVEEALYDLYLDPTERLDVKDGKEYRDIFLTLSSRLDQWMKDTDDPLLQGRVPKPDGALVNSDSCFSPNDELYEPL